jgi:hypothetical protein
MGQGCVAEHNSSILKKLRGRERDGVFFGPNRGIASAVIQFVRPESRRTQPDEQVSPAVYEP